MQIPNLKYNYIIYGDFYGDCFGELYLQAYSDLRGYDNVVIQPSFRQLVGKYWPLYRVHFSSKFNRIVHLPFKQIWFPFYSRVQFPNDKPVCALFTRQWARIAVEFGFNSYLRHKYKGYKSVSFFTDLIYTQKNFYCDKYIDLPLYKSSFDLILSFDQGDSEKYEMIYHPLVNSKYKGEVMELPMSDVYFLGQPKNRLPQILETFEVLRDNGLKLDFYLANVKPKNQIYKEEIHYIDNFMSYQENLQHTLHTRCLLEIMQKGGLGYTQRAMEAICEGKKLLTNNSTIAEAPFFNPKYISCFTSAKNIDVDFLKRIPLEEEIDYCYRDIISPIELIRFIDDRL
ncbi:hypothetical protein [uncultured Bacteroides sp.]|uniref:hypothetical protein n=1 Tax=uncultured Bacteroides sp. TaxID=162156 RepID=UPI0026236E6A|nr:hypothetical protein [uncultured Bacteroides sp.]